MNRFAAATVGLAALVLCAWVSDPSGWLRANLREPPRRIVIRPLAPPTRIVIEPDTCEIVDVFPEEGPGFLWGKTRVTRQRCKVVLPRHRRR